MTRLEQQRFISDCLSAAALFRIALDACAREAKAKNDKARRKARSDAEYLSFVFFSYIYHAEGDLRKVLHVIADALVGKPPQYCRPSNDKIEQAVAAAFGGKNDVQYLMNAPFSFRRFKKELALLLGVTPKTLPYADNSLRRTLSRRGHNVSGEPGRPKKSPRLPTE
jgi:hypothetical protein